jgi:hypothetical protein
VAGGEIHAWGLLSRNYWLDDDMGELVVILDLPYSEALLLTG